MITTKATEESLGYDKIKSNFWRIEFCLFSITNKHNQFYLVII